MTQKKVYIAGDMLNMGAQMQRKMEKDTIEAMGHQFYNPQDNKEINDKSNAVNEGLAERIVTHDTDAIKWSDTVLVEPLAHAQGTICELGQIKGMKDVAQDVLNMIYAEENIDLTPQQLVDSIEGMCRKHIERKVIPHYEDIRRVDGLTETGDRRSFGMHQYVYGVCLDLTEGKGMYSWEEAQAELSE